MVSVETSPPSKPSSIAMRVPITREASDQIFSLVCLMHREVETDTLRDLYWRGLEDLTMDQAKTIAEIILKSTAFWPTPGKLRELAGIPNPEETRKRAALLDLDKVLGRLKTCAHDTRLRADFLANVKRNLAKDPITRAMEIFGGGSLTYAVDLLCMHPRFLRADDDRESIGLELSAIEKIEAKWFAAWREAMNV